MANWKKSEILWLIVATIVILGLSLYWGDTSIGIISAITGVWCVVCTGKGSLWAYIWGLINCVLYGWIALEAKYYGETMLNWLYYVPMQFYGFYVWFKHMNPDTHEVKKRSMSLKGKALLILAILGSAFIYGLVLRLINGNLPFVDAFTTMASIIAMIISIHRYSEQWWIWIFVNIFSIGMYVVDVMNGSNNYATVLMWLVYLINAIIMLRKWNHEAENEEVLKNA